MSLNAWGLFWFIEQIYYFTLLLVHSPSWVKSKISVCLVYLYQSPLGGSYLVFQNGGSSQGGVIGPWYCIMVLTCKIPVPPGPTHPWYQTVSDTCPSPGSGPTPRTIERPKTMYILSAILKYSIFKLFSLLSRCGTLYTVSDMDFLEFQKGS